MVLLGQAGERHEAGEKDPEGVGDEVVPLLHFRPVEVISGQVPAIHFR